MKIIIQSTTAPGKKKQFRWTLNTRTSKLLAASPLYKTIGVCSRVANNVALKVGATVIYKLKQ